MYRALIVVLMQVMPSYPPRSLWVRHISSSSLHLGLIWRSACGRSVTRLGLRRIRRRRS